MNNVFRQALPVLLGVVSASGCGAVQLSASYRSFGELNIERDSAIQKAFLESRGKPVAGIESVKVLVDSLPAGLTLSSGVLSVNPGFQHVVVGKFVISTSFRFFPDYVDGWRKGVCWWQQPLVIATAFVWLAVPTYYGCYSTNVRDKRDIVAETKRLVRLSDSDAAIISFIADYSEQAWGARGFIIKLDPRMKGKPLDTTPVPKKPAGGPI